MTALLPAYGFRLLAAPSWSTYEEMSYAEDDVRERILVKPGRPRLDYDQLVAINRSGGLARPVPLPTRGWSCLGDEDPKKGRTCGFCHRQMDMQPWKIWGVMRHALHDKDLRACMDCFWPRFDTPDTRTPQEVKWDNYFPRIRHDMMETRYWNRSRLKDVGQVNSFDFRRYGDGPLYHMTTMFYQDAFEIDVYAYSGGYFQPSLLGCKPNHRSAIDLFLYKATEKFLETVDILKGQREKLNPMQKYFEQPLVDFRFYPLREDEFSAGLIEFKYEDGSANFSEFQWE